MAAAAVVTTEGCDIATPYRADFVDDLKASIPAPYRQWKPEQRLWRIVDPYIDPALALTRYYFPDLRVSDRRRTRIAAAPPPGDWVRVLHDAVPAELRPAVFRALAHALHPDAGGDTRLMQQLNDGWS
jgi:hypothetical protein